MNAAVFRAAMPHLQTLEAALGDDEFETGFSEGMCDALYQMTGKVYSAATHEMRDWAADLKGTAPKTKECCLHYAMPLSQYLASKTGNRRRYEKAYTTRVLFLELLALLAEDGQVAA